MSETYFIKAPCNGNAFSDIDEKELFSCDFIKKKYDMEYEINLFDISVNKSNGQILLLDNYVKLFDHIEHLNKKKIITIGGDSSLCMSTIPQFNKIYNDLQVIFVTPNPMNNDDIKSRFNLNYIIVSYLLGIKFPILFRKFDYIKPEQITYFGINDEIYEIENLLKYELEFYTTKKINQIGTKQIIDLIKEKINLKSVHIVLDLAIFDNNQDILKNVLELLTELKDDVVSMDIVNSIEYKMSEKNMKLSSELCKSCIKEVLDIKEKKINIFNENSPFIIFRQMDQVNPIVDIGWYILRGLDFELREQLLKSIEDDQIISFTIDNEDFLITKTTVSEQNEKSYYLAKTINDTTLFPSEKEVMLFELINLSK